MSLTSALSGRSSSLYSARLEYSTTHYLELMEPEKSGTRVFRLVDVHEALCSF